ncbi:hypothetical protein ACH4TX_13285 [Streptomyces sp. NPDC021098]|uniref:hypothetical protein n=1 Tax=unclassified Streptomyces TaxID=2593676 RepID=UPI0037B23EDC
MFRYAFLEMTSAVADAPKAAAHFSNAAATAAAALAAAALAAAAAAFTAATADGARS